MGAHPLERFPAGDISDGEIGARPAEVARRFLPPLGRYAVLLAEQADEDACLLLAEAGQRLHPREQVGAVACLRPDTRRGTVVRRDEVAAKLLYPPGHRAWEPVQRGRPSEHLGQHLRVIRRDLGRVEVVAEPLPKFRRRGERPFEGYLLVEHHPDQQRQRVVGKQLVGSYVAAQVELGRFLLSHVIKPSGG